MSELKGKFALITGGAKGIGLACAREFLINGIQGVTLIDINAEKGLESTRLLNEEFGEGKVIFFAVDVTNKTQFKDAFEKSFKHWKQLDIVVNNAAIIAECNWESALFTNCGGTLSGTLLGFEYMSKSQKGHGGIIVNMGSLVGIVPFPTLPTYTASKAFIISLSRSFGDATYFEHNEVKVLTVCPGATTTDFMKCNKDMYVTHLCPNIEQIMNRHLGEHVFQRPEELAQNLITVIKEGSNGSVWLIANNKASELDFSSLGQQCSV